jgi:hypothetical protein
LAFHGRGRKRPGRWLRWIARPNGVERIHAL